MTRWGGDKQKLVLKENTHHFYHDDLVSKSTIAKILSNVVHKSIKPTEAWMSKYTTHKLLFYFHFLTSSSPTWANVQDYLLENTSADAAKWPTLGKKEVIELKSPPHFISHNKCTFCCPDLHQYAFTTMVATLWFLTENGLQMMVQCSPHCFPPLEVHLKCQKATSCQDVWQLCLRVCIIFFFYHFFYFLVSVSSSLVDRPLARKVIANGGKAKWLGFYDLLPCLPSAGIN